MSRKTIDLTKDAANIYDNWPWKDKGRFTSEAIIRYEENKKGISLEQEIKQLKNRVEELERRMEK